jgi:Mg/Co/Ni transporter MgtE
VDLASEPLISAQAHHSVRSVVDLFHKYNLMSLPVVDEEAHLLGIVTADDVLEHVINRSIIGEFRVDLVSSNSSMSELPT